MVKAYPNMSILAGKDFTTKLNYGLKVQKLWNEVNPMHLLALLNVGSMGIAFREIAHSDSLTELGYSRSQLADHAKVYLANAIRLSRQTGVVSSRAHLRGRLLKSRPRPAITKTHILSSVFIRICGIHFIRKKARIA